MRCPTVNVLPVPPPGKAGWPWTEEGPQLPDTLPNGEPWPKISIVTPNYNYGEFIEKTIRSVLLQGYPNLEYIIIDGGSSDDSVEIIRKYEPWLTHWESEADRGQSHAINKGFSKATGEIFAWINSDDYYLSGALSCVANAYDETVGLLVGITKQEDRTGTLKNERRAPSLAVADIADWTNGNWFRQPGCFFQQRIFEEAGGLDEALHYAMDFDLWLKLAATTTPKHIDECLAVAKLHPGMKTQNSDGRLFAEHRLVQIRHGAEDIATREIERLYLKAQKLEARLGPFLKSIRFLRRLKREIRSRVKLWAFLKNGS